MHWCKALDSRAVETGVTNHTSLSGNPMDKSELGGCQDNGTCLTVKFGGGGIMGCGSFSGLGLDPLVPVKETLYASAYQDINFWTISCSQLCGNSLGTAYSCSNMTAHQCTKQGL